MAHQGVRGAAVDGATIAIETSLGGDLWFAVADRCQL